MGNKKNNRSKKYIKPKSYNPIIIEKKIENMKAKIDSDREDLKKFLKSLDISNANHISLLSNFAQHDIKNSVQSMDTIISSNSLDEFTEQHIDSLKIHLNLIRNTISNFAKLVPYVQKEGFEFSQLVSTIEKLNKEGFYVNKIEFVKEIPEGDFYFHLPFQSVVQMLNNIIINAIKAYNTVVENRRIKLDISFDENNFYIKIFDNADEIPFENIDSVFDYGVSSTGGSGIGLYHARYLCDLYKGSIKVIKLEEKGEFNKYFFITLPLIKN